jgi:hypothetical protein
VNILGEFIKPDPMAACEADVFSGVNLFPADFVGHGEAG